MKQVRAEVIFPAISIGGASRESKAARPREAIAASPGWDDHTPRTGLWLGLDSHRYLRAV